MKTPIRNLPKLARLVALVLLSTLNLQLSTFAQGTAFTYQGRFNTNSTPYTGAAEFQFTLWDALSGGSAVATNSPASVVATVADGLFTVALDFGSNPFNGQPRFLQIEARTAIGSFTTLSPRHPVTPTPYALRALNLATNGLAAGTYASAITFNNGANSFNGTFTGNGAGLNSVNATLLDGVDSAGFWRLNGNSANFLQFIGTTNFQTLRLAADGKVALRLEPRTNGAPNIIGGSLNNLVDAGVVAAFIGGGGGLNANGDSLSNRIASNYGVIGGGDGNLITPSAAVSTIGGGSENMASGVQSTIGGGWRNRTSNTWATVSGGAGNRATGRYATVPGGSDNTALSDYSFAAGRRARANHEGSFVWADSFFSDFASTANDQFSVRAHGGVLFSDETSALSFGSQTRQMVNLFGVNYGIGVQSSTTYFRSNSRFSWFRDGTHSDTENAPGAGGVVAMTLTSSGLTVNGVVVSSSDRHLKAGFTPVDPKTMLEKVIALPIQRWHFTNDASTPHFGPMAQDFYAAFGLGTDDKHIATVDADGVALAAIQGLNQKVEDLSGELKRRDAENADLKLRLEKLEQLVNPGNGGVK